MVKSKRSDSSSTVELSELVGADRDNRVTDWKTKLNTNDNAQRTLNLHAVMREVQALKSQYSDASVDAVLKVIYPDRSKRARLKRLHEIPRNVLRKAMTTYRKSEKGQGDSRSSFTLSTTHLEFLGGCKDAGSRIELLNTCASERWTVAQLRVAVQAGSGSKTVRPLELAKRIRTQVKQLVLTLSEVTESGLLESVTKVKVRDQQNAVAELLAAAKELTKLRNQLSQKSESLRAAHKELKRLTK